VPFVQGSIQWSIVPLYLDSRQFIKGRIKQHRNYACLHQKYLGNLRASGIPLDPASQFTPYYSGQQYPPQFWNSTMPWKAWPQKQVQNHPWKQGW
jgi:hypothetical protein